MSRLTRCVAVVGIVSMGWSVVGCTSDDTAPRSSTKVGFRAAYSELRDDYAARSAEIQRQAAQSKGQGLDATLEVFSAIKASADDAASEFRALRTPAPVQPALTQLLQLLAEQSDLLDRLIEAGKKRNNAVVAQATTQLTTLSQRIGNAALEIERAMASCGSECD